MFACAHEREHGLGLLPLIAHHCTDPAVTAVAINRSDWCFDCAGGRYVTGLIRR